MCVTRCAEINSVAWLHHVNRSQNDVMLTGRHRYHLHLMTYLWVSKKVLWPSGNTEQLWGIIFQCCPRHQSIYLYIGTAAPSAAGTNGQLRQVEYYSIAVLLRGGG